MRLVGRIHNPAGLRCGCPPECVCRRSRLGRAFRWYIPGRFHTRVRPEDTERLRAEGREFRDA